MNRRMSEAKFRAEVIKLLKCVGAFPVENVVHVGVPDVHCTLGWIELKIAEIPNSTLTVPKIDLRNSQRLWLKNWAMLGGRAWALTRFASDSEQLFLMHDANWASEYLGRATMQEHLDHAVLNSSIINTITLISTMRKRTCS